jgi:hypothetical protein
MLDLVPKLVMGALGLKAHILPLLILFFRVLEGSSLIFV